MSICLSVCPRLETRILVDLRLLVEEGIANIGIPPDFFAVFIKILCFDFLCFFLGLLLWLLGVGVSDR